MSRDDTPSKKVLKELYRIVLGQQLNRSGMAGQALTNYTCLRCEDEFTHGNTMTPYFCPDCTKSLYQEFKNEPR
jgi:DNA-directed RNA polymerase subunit RPC12/RpoP